MLRHIKGMNVLVFTLRESNMCRRESSGSYNQGRNVIRGGGGGGFFIAIKGSIQ